MSRFVVMQKADDAAGAIFVRDSFSLPAFIVPHLWLLFYRQWLAAVAVFSLMILIALLARQWDLSLFALGANFLISLYVALEGATLRIANLERDGFNGVAVVEAAEHKEAEIRYFGALPQSVLTPAPELKPAVNFSMSSANAFAFPAKN